MAAQVDSLQLDTVDSIISDKDIKDSIKTAPLQSANQQMLAKKIIDLMYQVDSSHKTLYVTSKIQKTHKYDRAKALVQGDVYIEAHIQSMAEEDLNELYENIIVGLKNNSQAMANKKTFNAVHSIVSGKTPKTTESVVKEAYQAIGNVFANTLQQEELRQYNEANLDPNLKGRGLEETEFKLCGHPYEQVLRDNLHNLKDFKSDNAVYKKFNEAIRAQLKKYQNKDISALELQIRLRYAIAKLAMALEQAGFVSEATAIRKEHFGEEFAGDGLAGAFVDRNKVEFNKPRPKLTNKTRELAASYWEKIKLSTRDLQSFLGFGNKPLPPGIAVSENLHKEVGDFITKLEDFPTDEEARRKLYNRVHNVEQWYNYYQLELQAASGIPDGDSIFEEFPFQRQELISAFNRHAEKLHQRLQPDDPDSYHPGIKPHRNHDK